MKKFSNSATAILVSLLLPIAVLYITVKVAAFKGEPEKVEVKLKSEHISSVDHSQFEILQQDFATPHDVTAACLSCHTGRDEEVMATAHWKWEREVEIPGKGKVSIGKKNLLNNFCTGANGNNGSCMRCHIGLGWKDKTFDFSDNLNIDCLVCHDQTDTYFKQKGQAGLPATEETANAAYQVPDYPYVAQNVGLPKKNNCGICHFYGGGGNNVKHGDLEEALLSCSKHVDVHMTNEGPDMACIDCHTTERHNIKGKLYSVSSMNENRIDCDQCHTATPHNDAVLDQHFEKLACQTCHIPEYAKANATKMYWDWSSAGMLDDAGHGYSEDDADGNHNYLSIKGNFVWDDNVKPEYYWFNGTADHFLTTDTISEIPVKINELFGEYRDSTAKIWPVKVHRGKQIYDVDHNTLINLKLWAAEKGEGAYWKDFDWDTASRLGMEYNDRPYSGNYDFVASEAYWPINHMVSPKEETLTCTECHSREGRLDNLKDFYLPGRDYSKPVDYAGVGLIILTLVGIFAHFLGRVVAFFKNK
ncbi:tetrathionate reductase family octaheme c-type cytochrome [Carboxylicivirga sp. N1Y90]|uniref:tetrathionate reductase family octaheme c-type cytochrome n=1 Tax=Carboxylicivirga fragile TaxID=3417571 RepID=UPI003D331774|nr:tetrathionate reductase family octaheme c-type cytochrome [Marinilabiliaceae bacterium N1Y90]